MVDFFRFSVVGQDNQHLRVLASFRGNLGAQEIDKLSPINPISSPCRVFRHERVGRGSACLRAYRQVICPKRNPRDFTHTSRNPLPRFRFRSTLLPGIFMRRTTDMCHVLVPQYPMGGVWHLVSRRENPGARRPSGVQTSVFRRVLALGGDVQCC